MKNNSNYYIQFPHQGLNYYDEIFYRYYKIVYTAALRFGFVFEEIEKKEGLSISFEGEDLPDNLQNHDDKHNTNNVKMQGVIVLSDKRFPDTILVERRKRMKQPRLVTFWPNTPGQNAEDNETSPLVRAAKDGVFVPPVLVKEKMYPVFKENPGMSPATLMAEVYSAENSGQYSETLSQYLEEAIKKIEVLEEENREKDKVIEKKDVELTEEKTFRKSESERANEEEMNARRARLREEEAKKIAYQENLRAQEAVKDAELERKNVKIAEQQAEIERLNAKFFKQEADLERQRAEKFETEKTELSEKINIKEDENQSLKDKLGIALKEIGAYNQEKMRGQAQGQSVNLEAAKILRQVDTNYLHRNSICTRLIFEDGSEKYMKIATFDRNLEVTRKAQRLINKRVKITCWDPYNEPGKWSRQNYFRNIYEV